MALLLFCFFYLLVVLSIELGLNIYYFYNPTISIRAICTVVAIIIFGYGTIIYNLCRNIRHKGSISLAMLLFVAAIAIVKYNLHFKIYLINELILSSGILLIAILLAYRAFIKPIKDHN